jgi:hypothetical protein
LSFYGVFFPAYGEREAAKATAMLANTNGFRREMPAAPSGGFRFLEERHRRGETK